MSTFPAVYAHEGDWEALLNSCLQQLDASYDTATLGFVYVTDVLSPDMERIVDGLRLSVGGLAQRGHRHEPSVLDAHLDLERAEAG